MNKNKIKYEEPVSDLIQIEFKSVKQFILLRLLVDYIWKLGAFCLLVTPSTRLVNMMGWPSCYFHAVRHLWSLCCALSRELKDLHLAFHSGPSGGTHPTENTFSKNLPKQGWSTVGETLVPSEGSEIPERLLSCQG